MKNYFYLVNLSSERVWMCEDAVDQQSNFRLTFHVLYTIHNCAVFLYHCALLFGSLNVKTSAVCLISC